MKRVKSFLISAVSFLVPVVVVVVASPEFLSFAGDTQNFLVAKGVPLSIILVVGKLIDEAWRAFLNSRERGLVRGVDYTAAGSW